MERVLPFCLFVLSLSTASAADVHLLTPAEISKKSAEVCERLIGQTAKACEHRFAKLFWHADGLARLNKRSPALIVNGGYDQQIRNLYEQYGEAVYDFRNAGWTWAH